MSRGTVVLSWFKKRIRVVLPGGRFARNVMILAVGTALGQAITVLASPVLTRLYTPEDFGVLAVYSSILGILSVVAGWRYELAIPLPEKDEDAINLVALSLGIVVLMSFLAGLGVWFWGVQIVHWVNVPALLPYLWLLPVGVSLVGSYQVFNYWVIRKQVFGVIAQTRIRQGLGAVAIQISVGLVKPLPLGLLLGQVVGQAAGVLTLLRLFCNHTRNLWEYVNADELAKLSRRYIRFPLYASWAGVLNTLSVQVPILILSSLFGATVTGFYLLAYRVLWLPTQMVGQSASQVLLSAAAEAVRRGDVANLVLVVFKRLLVVGVPCFVLIGFLAPDVAALIFGHDWEEAGFLIQWLTPWILLVFVTSPLSVLSIVLEKQPQEVFFQTILLMSRVGALFGGWALGSAYTAIILFSLASTICWISYLIWILSLVYIPIKVGAGLVFKEIAVNSFFFLPLILIKGFVHNPVWLLPGALVTFFLVTIRLVFIFRVKGKSNV